MSTTPIKFIRTTEDQINAISYENGTLIFTDEGNIYNVFPNGNKVKCTGGKTIIVTVDTTNHSASHSGDQIRNLIKDGYTVYCQHPDKLFLLPVSRLSSGGLVSFASIIDSYIYQCKINSTGAQVSFTEKNFYSSTETDEVIQNALANQAPLFDYIRYQELRALRDESRLIPGTFYLIQDYNFVPPNDNYEASPESTFHIVVQALTSNTLSETAQAVSKNSHNEYINAYQVKYSLDNDTLRFPWATSQKDENGQEKGKGVIYYLKDNNGNECPYDFKHIKFKWPSEQQENYKDALAQFNLEPGQIEYFYTFSKINPSNPEEIKDASQSDLLSGRNVRCSNNSISFTNTLTIPLNIFIQSVSTTSDETIINNKIHGSPYNIKNNIFFGNCNYNTLLGTYTYNSDRSCSYNVLINSSNISLTDAKDNFFKDCSYNTLLSTYKSQKPCSYNVLINSSNISLTNAKDNCFKNSNFITLDRESFQNQFDNAQAITMGAYNVDNTIVDGTNIKFGSGNESIDIKMCSAITIGDDCGNSLFEDSYDLILGNSNQDISIKQSENIQLNNLNAMINIDTASTIQIGTLNAGFNITGINDGDNYAPCVNITIDTACIPSDDSPINLTEANSHSFYTTKKQTIELEPPPMNI